MSGICCFCRFTTHTSLCEDPNRCLSSIAVTSSQKSTGCLEPTPTQHNTTTTAHNQTLWAYEQNPDPLSCYELRSDSEVLGFPSFLELDLETGDQVQLPSAPSPSFTPTPIDSTNTSFTQQPSFAEQPSSSPESSSNDTSSSDTSPPTNFSSTPSPEQQPPYLCGTCGKKFQRKCDRRYALTSTQQYTTFEPDCVNGQEAHLEPLQATSL